MSAPPEAPRPARPGRMARRLRRRQLLFALTAVGIAALALEAAARLVELWRPPAAVDYGLGFDASSRVFVPDPGAAGWLHTPRAKQRSFVAQRFEAHKPPGVLRLAAVGGSSVHYLDPVLREMAAAIARDLAAAAAPGGAAQAAAPAHAARIDVINAGGRSYGTHRLVRVVAELLAYEPDLLLLYTGNNEFEELEQMHLAQRASDRIEARLARSAFVRLLRDALTQLRISPLERAHEARVLADRPRPARAWRQPFEPEEVARRMAGFEANLEAMIGLARAHDVPVLIGTVPSNHLRPALAGADWDRFAPALALYRAGRFAEGYALARRALREARGRHQASSVENGIVRRVAARSGAALVDFERVAADAEPHGVPGETLFRDHCHLDEQGHAVWRRAFEPAVRALLAERFRARTARGGATGDTTRSSAAADGEPDA